MNFLQKNRIPILSIIILLTLSFLSLFFGGVGSLNTKSINTGDTAWMITATAFVLIMTPGLAFFYGGMVSKKNVISTMLQSFISMALISVIWVVFGFSLSFGDSFHGIIGNPKTFFMMKNVLSSDPWPLASTVPLIVFAFFQLKFAIITPALITGTFAGRVRFLPYLLFITLFSIFIYAPLAHLTWHPNGLLYKLGVLDFAGGTVVHMSAGIAALACAIYLKSQIQDDIVPARITYVLIGTGLLWFGWIGFNGGSAMGANSLAAMSLATTIAASASAAFSWMLFELLRGKKPTAMGMCIGAVVGLVAITPAAGFVSVSHAIFIGLISSIVSSLMVIWRTKTSIDDTLDVFPCHGVGGMMGMLLTGVFASKNLNPGNTTGNGLFFGETKLFLVQLLAMVLVFAFVFISTWILLRLVNFITPLRASVEEEKLGLDITQHGEKL
jgi:ammonium transporter, Amt family